MRQNIDFADRYQPATLLLMWRNGGSIRLDGTDRPYNAFYEIMRPLLRPEDEEIYSSVQRGGSEEGCWHIGLRFALLQMREDKHPEDGRIKYLGDGLYKMNDRGRDSLKSYLYSSHTPLEWLELDVEESEDGTVLHHYLHPMNGEDVVTFGV